MAGNIKGITIEIGGETTKLQKALTDVNKKSKDLQSELRQVDKLLKLNPKDTEMLSQKQKLLAEAVANSKEKLDRLKTAQEQVNEQFRKGEISEEQYRAFQREVVKAEQELAGFEKQLEATAKASKSLGEKMKDAGEKMKNVGDTMTKYVTVPLAAAGAGAVAMGKTFDDAFDNIRIGTGATGKALEGLNDDFRKVAKQVPSSFGDISTAIADYNTRLGISGQALQDLSVQTLNLARITDSDLGKTIEETSQSFQAFNIPVEKYGESLDYVFKVSQSTGIGIDRLQQNLVKFSPALKQMGFDFYESAALMGFFDKAGVEVEQAMTGLNKALVNMAKAGITDANEALRKLFDEIKNAPNDIKASEIAIEIFGAKAGPALASAIREGKLGYEELVAELEKSKETINGVADETDDWAESLLKLKNRIAIATEPLATSFFDAINKLIDPLEKQLVPAIEDLAEGFSTLPKPVQGATAAFVGFAAAIGPILQGIGMIVIAAPALGPIFTGIGAVLSGVFTGIIAAVTGVASTIGAAFGWLAEVVFPALWVALEALAAFFGISVGWMVAIIVGLIAAGVLLVKNWDTIKAKLTEVWGAIKQTAENIWNSLKDFFQNWGETILLIAIGPAGWAVLLTKKLAENWDGIKNTTNTAWIGIKSGLSGTWNSILSTAANVWGGIKNAIVSPIREAQNILNSIISSIKNAFANMRIEIPKPKLPHISVNWKSVGVGDAKVKIPDFDLNWYAKGGIFDRPSIIGVGEAGTEAVIPLDKMPGLIADALRDAMGGNQVAMAGGITVQNMYVRNDQDIKLVARELYNLQQQNARGRGLK